MRDIELAQFQGAVLAKLESIEAFMSKADKQLAVLEEERIKQKAYLAVAVMIGGAVMWIVDTVLKVYSSIK